MNIPRFNRFLTGGVVIEEQPRAWTEDEMYEWRRERNKRWEREQDIARGYWEVSPPLTTDEEEETQQLTTNYALYEEVRHTEPNGRPWTEWILRDPDMRERLEALVKKMKTR